ncbi:MAG: hypothetical protein Q9169_000420 [Polycauliona sp. 2 TL-2023]
MKRKRRPSDDSDHQPYKVRPQVQHLSHVDIPAVTSSHAITPEPGCSDGSKDRTSSSPSYKDQTDRMDWQHMQSTHRSIHPQTMDPNLTPPSEPSPDIEVNSILASTHADLHENIAAHFDLRILSKHSEMRFIDQEIAKCQLALEQLRRCQVIPYPAMSSSWEEMQAVANGTGPVRSNAAESAPPWGVTDGPYTRHYRRWLIPDTAFGDRVTQEVPVAQPSRTGLDRSVRASTSGKSSLVNQSRSQRGPGSARLQALPHGYPEVKEDKGPMIVKRSSDGKMVKLVCPVCERLDFSNVQGFINHCRIAHSRNFQSHDQAANVCGEEVELDEAGRIVGEIGTPNASNTGLVHPLITGQIPRPAPSTVIANIRSRTLATPGHEKQVLTRSPVGGDSSSQAPPQTPASRTPASAAPAAAPFQPSPLTPYLSNLLSKRGRGIDLEEEVNLAMTKYDVDADIASDDDAGESETELEFDRAAGSECGPVNHSTRGVVRPDHPPNGAVMPPSQVERSTNVKPAKPGARRPKNLTNLASYPTTVACTDRQSSPSHHGSMNPSIREGQIHNEAASPNLSPNTVVSYQAPSLISDDDDVENTHSECSSAADITEGPERNYFGVDFEGHDEHVMEEIESGDPKSSHQPQRSSAMRSPDGIRSPVINNSERHVTFASPMQRPRKKGSK